MMSQETIGIYSRACAGLVMFAYVGCAGPDTPVFNSGLPDATDTAVATTSSTTGSGTELASTSDTGDDPPVLPPPPFELPEGCGDGVIVPGQYNCFVPISLDWVPEAVGGSVEYHGFDLDGDGRTEIVVDGGVPKSVRLLRWEDGALQLSDPVETIGGTGSFDWVYGRWDWTGDGVPDFARLMTSTGDAGGSPILVHPNEAGSLGPHFWAHTWAEYDKYGPVADGFAVPIDEDGDGELEVLVSRKFAHIGQSNPPNELVVRKRVNGEWQTVHEPFPFGACGLLWTFAYGDFNEDGHEDVAIFDSATGCDPYPPTYDPSWYVVGVFLADPVGGQVQLAGWLPAGLITDDNSPRWARDLDGDGRLDLVVIGYPDTGGWHVAVMRGHGDGTFDEGKILTFDSPLPEEHKLRGPADLDGDGVEEWVANAAGATWVLPPDLSPGPISVGAFVRSPEDGWTTRQNTFLGDVNGDGVDDYIATNRLPQKYSFRYLMLSKP